MSAGLLMLDNKKSIINTFSEIHSYTVEHEVNQSQSYDEDTFKDLKQLEGHISSSARITG